jgi:hypothetical protein
MPPERRSLESRLRDALHETARRHPLRSDLAASVAAGLPDRGARRPRGWLAMAIPSAVALAAILVVIGYAVFASLNQGPTSGSTAPVPSGSHAAGSPTLAPTPSVAEVPLPLSEGQTFISDLAYDESRNAIWFVGFDGSDKFVFRVNAATSQVEKWPLPPGDYVGVYVQVKTDSAGIVWISDGYQVVRFDPATHQATTHKFSLNVPGALPGALTGGHPGTWVSGIAPSNGGLLVARHNVPWLTRLDASLAEVSRIPVSADDAGAQDLAVIGSTIFLERDENAGVSVGLDLVDDSGKVLASVAGPGGRLEVAGDRVLRHGRGSQYDVPIEWVNTDGTTVAVGQGNSAYPDPRGGVTLFRHLNGGQDEALQRVVDGTVVSSLALQGQTVQLKDCPLVVGPSGFSQPTCPEARIMFDLSDLVTDADGVTWYVSTNTTVIYRVQL